MTTAISFDPYLGWVDVTDPDAITEDTRIISAGDLLRYENLGQAVETFSTSVLADIANLSTLFEPKLAAGTATQFYRGDKTWQTLNAAAVGLGNVNNTTDAQKPVSTAQQAALDLKMDKTARAAANGVASLDGSTLIPHAQHRWWTGSINVPLNASTTGYSASITFPAGRFTAPPVILLTKQGGALAKFIPFVDDLSATGFRVGLYSGDGTTATGNVTVGILAVPAS